MLEPNKNSNILINDLEDFINVTFAIIDDFYQKVTPTHIKNRRNIDRAIMSDSEIITLSIVGELPTIDSEKACFGFCTKNLKDLFQKFFTRTRFHRTRKSLFKVVDDIRKEITKFFNYQYDEHRIMDSMPILVCKFGRAHFNKTFKHKAAYGKYVSKEENYYGFKLHSLITLDSYLTDFTLTPGNIDDRISVWELTESFKFSIVIGDKGYIGDKLALDLKSENSINFISLKKNNSKSLIPKKFR